MEVVRCRSCSSEVPASSRFCSSCGAGAPSQPHPEIEATIAMPSSYASRPRSRVVEDKRFLPGTLLAGRYRIIARLGKGGMGEVFRADDLTLGEEVALKFLPEATAQDVQTLTRFYDEVRIARQVTHPNVCRVYDIGEVNGQPYISMQYVDGEDLGALLLRIGRLPADKALEFARKLCAGLAAAHAQGVLHRDLKPANIMIDARGQVLITDFGLAGIAEQLQGAEVRNGTPAYMAPEQLTGTEVSVRSDIYALGLVLYEMFTGKQPFEAESLADMVRLRKQSTPRSITTLVADLDPRIEQVILRCLEGDPALRPSSALAIAAALPGGDPLAQALAAGETPSPEMVAAAGESEGLRPRTALMVLAAVVILLAAFVLLQPPIMLLSRLNLENPPDALAHKAREAIEKLGYSSRAIDRAYGFEYESDYLKYLGNRIHDPAAWDAVLAKRPSPVEFWYRQSPQYLFEPKGMVGGTAPPLSITGMVFLASDLEGRLTDFRAIPPQYESATKTAPPIDWAALFALAGLDPSAFHAVEPNWVPLAAIDSRAAWTGAYPDHPDAPIRVEAAGWHGKPVYFQIIGPWRKPLRMETETMTPGERAADTILACIAVGTLIAAAWFARRNLRGGRGDPRGAMRLGMFAFAVDLAAWVCRAHHLPTMKELDLVGLAMGRALFVGTALWMLYLAIEPYVRRHWPQTIITWSRVLAGRLNDPLVGRDVLLGTLFGVGYGILILGLEWGSWRLGEAPPWGLNLTSNLGVRAVLGEFLDHVVTAMVGGLAFFLIIFILRAILRKQWPAALVFVLIFTLAKSLAAEHPLMKAAFFALIYGLIVVIGIRFGLIALMTAIFIVDLIWQFLFTADFAAWYGLSSLMIVLLILGLALYGFRASLAGRKVLGDDFLQD
jgi:hypothetical protein